MFVHGLRLPESLVLIYYEKLRIRKQTNLTMYYNIYEMHKHTTHYQ